MGSDALEHALALHHTPALRFAVRARPLAENIASVIELAAASQPGLAQASARLGLAEDELLEAARFYLQQALFEAEPDAYRTLGVAPDAAIELIHRQYRELQRWLHPDRRGSEWEAQYASRLNWAWSQLRDPRARARYDAQRRQPDGATSRAAEAESSPALAQAMAWAAIPLPPARTPTYFLKRAALVTSLASCAALLYLALMHQDGPSHLAVPESSARVESNPPPRVVPQVVQTPAHAQSPEPIGLPAVSLVEPHLRLYALRSAIAEPRFASDVALVADPSRRSGGSVAAAAKLAAPSPQVPHAMQAQSSGPALGSSGKAQARSAAGGSGAGGGVWPQAGTGSPDVPHHDAGGATVTTASAPASPAALSASDLLGRIDRAREYVRGIVRYLRSQDGAEASARGLRLPDSVRLARKAMRQRVGLRGEAPFALDSPQWRVSDESARVEADYSVAGANGLAEHGRFRAHMLWRDEGWQLVHVVLEPRP